MERLKKYVSTDEFVDELHSNKLPSVIRIENDLLGFKNLNDDRYKFYEYNKTKNKLQLKISFSLWWKVEDNILYIRNDKQEGYQEKLLYVDKDKSLNNGWHLLDNKSEITKCVIENEVHPMSLCAAFNEFSGITAIEGVENIKTDKCKSLRGLTNKCTSLSSIDLSNWDVSNVTNMKIMFQLCSTLTSVGDLSNWDTSNVIDTGWMFYGCSSLASVDLSNWNMSNVTNLKSMFCNCSKLTSVGDLSNWDTSNVVDTSYMFNGCSKLKSIGDLSDWDMSNVTSTRAMFQLCSTLTSVGDLSNWDTSNVTNMIAMFNGCSKFTSIGDISNWDMSNVTSTTGMFNNCSKLTSIGDISNWNVSNVTDTGWMFYGCSSLTSIDLSNWNMSNVTNLKAMFYKCSKLTSVGDLSNWDTSNVTDMSYMFLSNKNLEDIDISKWDMSKVTTTDGLFNEAYKLKHISLPDNLRVLGTIDDKNFGYGCFNHASGYEDETFTLPKSMQYISYIMSFYNFGKDNVFKRFIIDQSNQYFTTDEYGILYSKDMTRLVAVPRAVDIGDTDTFTIPENVTTMGELSFSREHTFTKLVIPDNYVIVRNTSYSGLNTGNSLAIAIYKFTTIDTYIVNDTNPNYMSYNGCIYSKDGTELIAVPTRYDGDLVIKDGCTTIGEEAFWSDDAGEEGNVYTTYESEARGKYIKTIYIPASVTNIESNQIATLNGMFNGYTSTNSYKGVNAVDITIDENNPKYMVSTDASGKKSIVEK
jgi:surface protein